MNYFPANSNASVAMQAAKWQVLAMVKRHAVCISKTVRKDGPASGKKF
ncbi:MAG: hypothetical protein QM796_02050 [Chthoniobacteraceae bacterium]